ncbi:MAG TPA: alpha/beta hydrolase-fold protein [Chitinophagaceae bacterium]|nr:alpha/beta hydrolase-fold protein [Chitinophagaceae bacterium]
MCNCPKNLLPLLFLVVSCGNSLARQSLQTQQITLFSQQVNDSFDIHITLPMNYRNPQKHFPVVFYLDANLRSGNKMRTIIDEFNNKKHPLDAVFVGVGHFGNEHALRRRDFITPFKKNKCDSLISDDPNYGQAENFYRFIENELIPYVDQHYRVTARRSLVGHSLGGLFTFYCLFKKDRLFTNFIALSPSFWINSENIYEFEKRYRADSTRLHANVCMCVGGAERFNFILNGTRRMKTHLEKYPLEGLHLEYDEFPGQTHNSEVAIALNQVLPTLKSE